MGRCVYVNTHSTAVGFEEGMAVELSTVQLRENFINPCHKQGRIIKLRRSTVDVELFATGKTHRLPISALLFEIGGR